MNVRTAAAVAALASLALGAPAFAATKPKPKPKPVCMLLTDATGDGTTMGAVPSRGALDIVSADLATGSRNVVVVLRLASLASDPTLTTGVSYTVSWGAGGVGQTVLLLQYSDGTRVSSFDPDTAFGKNDGEGAVPFLVDAATSTVTWTIPRKANPVLAKRGVKFGSFEATATPSFNVSTASATPVSFTSSASVLSGDDAQSGKTYTDLAPSCVKGV
jgi:hypothetical protein